MFRRGGRAAALALACIACAALAIPSCDGVRSPALAGGDGDAGRDVPPRGPVASSPGSFLGDLSRTTDGSASVSWERDGSVASAAGEVLEAYADEGGCRLVLGGYLGISDGAWGAIVQGASWVDAVYVTEAEGVVLVRIVRTKAEEDGSG